MAQTPTKSARAQSAIAALRELANLHGVQTQFTGLHGRQSASAEAILAVLAALDAPVARLADVPSALRAARLAPWRQGSEPVSVAWAGTTATVALRQRAKTADQPLDCALTLESGETRRWRAEATELAVEAKATVEGTDYVARRLKLPRGLPAGYHQLQIKTRGCQWETCVLAAPRRAYAPLDPPADGRPAWGVFLPLYALRTARDWGVGDFGDLAALVDWTTELGGRLVGSLPLLPAFLDAEPFEYSPYAPVSRLAWNELYVDPTRLPELADCPAAQERLAAPAFQAEQARLRALDEVDYRAVAALKRPILAALAERLFRGNGERRAAFETYLRAQPRLADYARFRAATEQHGAPWSTWPQAQREGTLDEGEYSADAWRYHAYAQWAAAEQLGALGERARRRGARLYLDLPLGVHPEGYDVWREREAFACGISGGAPPDMFFTGGQTWGFPPLHPEGIRRQHYRYFVDALRHHLRLAGVLRIDHVMGFHRLYWVPEGFGPRDGVYVRYQPEEFYAVLSIESQRHQAALVGEDLGIVPAEVRQNMARHGLQRMYTALYELSPHAQHALSPVPANALASVETHDMPTWLAYWEGRDIAERQALGLLDEAGAQAAASARARLRAVLVRFLGEHGLLPYHLPGWEVRWDGDYLWLTDHGTTGAAQSVLSGVLGWLATSAAPLMVVNLEDLWFEPRPQNVPGTWQEQPNWRRRARYTFEEFTRLPELIAMLGGVDGQRAAAAVRRNGGEAS